MILVIDNYDSFTYNLVQLIGSLGEKCKVFANDKVTISEIEALKPKKIVISPGPGNTDDAGISNEVIRHFYKKVPILGVCLGHQCIGVAFGAELTHAKQIMHGKTSKIQHSSEGLFKNTSNPMVAARYHSLVLDGIKAPLEAIASSEDGSIMGIKHRDFPVWGVQFHPESFLTPDGETIIRNFLA